MKWSSEYGSLMLKRLKIRDLPSLFEALTLWPATFTVGNNYRGNAFFGMMMIHDDVNGDDILFCTNFLKGNETFQYSKYWVKEKGPDFFLYVFDDLKSKGWCL